VEWLENQSIHLILLAGHTIGLNPTTLLAVVAALDWRTFFRKKGMQENQIQTAVISRITTCKGIVDTSSCNKELPGMKDSRP